MLATKEVPGTTAIADEITFWFLATLPLNVSVRCVPPDGGGGGGGGVPAGSSHETFTVYEAVAKPRTLTNAVVAPDGTVSEHVSAAPFVYGRHAYDVVVAPPPNRT